MIPQRLVEVDVRLRLVIPQPRRFDPERIEAHYNEGSWCGDNVMGLIEQALALLGGPCLCGQVEIRYVRDVPSE